MKHGLSSGDYAEYRKYCGERVKRLCKLLRVKDGNYLKKIKRAITAAKVPEERFLRVALFSAERAWSRAMEKKLLEDARKGGRAIQSDNRFARNGWKAIKRADRFSKLCSIGGDSRTRLEARGYASHMRGKVLFEQRQSWDGALKALEKARAVYEKLEKKGDPEHQDLCRKRLEELKPMLSCCVEKIGETAVEKAPEMDMSKGH